MATCVAGKNPEPQLVMAGKQGENTFGEDERDAPERGLVGGPVSWSAAVSDQNNWTNKKGRVAASRADVDRAETMPAHGCIEKPDFQHALNFEQQLQDIDDAINGSISALNSTTTQEDLLSKESNMQAKHVTTLKLKEGMQESGPEAVVQAQPILIGPKGDLNQPMHESKEVVGLFHPGVSFSLGLPSPKQKTAQGVSKLRGGSQKKNKGNREASGKENTSGREETQLQEVKTNEGSNMDLEMVDTGLKRRARAPLAELESQEDNGKRRKKEGEIVELGKLLAQHLGAAEAAMQPRRTQ